MAEVMNDLQIKPNGPSIDSEDDGQSIRTDTDDDSDAPPSDIVTTNDPASDWRSRTLSYLTDLGSAVKWGAVTVGLSIGAAASLLNDCHELYQALEEEKTKLEEEVTQLRKANEGLKKENARLRTQSSKRDWAFGLSDECTSSDSEEGSCSDTSPTRPTSSRQQNSKALSGGVKSPGNAGKKARKRQRD